MPTKDGFAPGHPLPHFLSEESARPSIGKACDRPAIWSRILKMSILAVTATAIATATWMGDPVALFTSVTASLVDISVFRPGTVQLTTTIQPIAAQALPPNAMDAPTTDEVAAAAQSADQSQAEIRQPSGEALLKQFQAWSAEEDARAQVVPVQPVQDASAPVVQNVPAQVAENAQPVPPMQRHRLVRRVQNARAEIRRMPNARAEIRRKQNVRVQVQPVEDARAQDVQNANKRLLR
jgi:hypothetical protein